MKSSVSLILFALTVVVTSVPGWSKAQEGGSPGYDLLKAYKREYAYLEAEKASLENRLREFDSESSSRLSAAESELARLQQQLLELITRADGLSDQLVKSEQGAAVSNENQEQLASAYEQAAGSLGKYVQSLEKELSQDEAAQATQLAAVFSQSIALLFDLARVRQEDGQFFLPGGQSITGRIIRVGNVASYGISDRGSGPLAPAGEGRLMLWGTEGDAAARAMASGKAQAVMPIFIYEGLDKAVEKKKIQNILQHIDSGGAIAWIIAGVGLLALLLIIARTVLLHKAGSSTDRVVNLLLPLIKGGFNQRALEICRRQKGVTARVLAATIRNLDRDREHLEDVISESILHETPRLDRFGSVILVLAAVAPLLGLLGTVTGMIATFDIITEFGTGDPKLLSSGISEALITTELGLVVAIPSLLIGNLLSGWSESIKSGMVKAALNITNNARGVGESWPPPAQARTFPVPADGGANG